MAAGGAREGTAGLAVSIVSEEASTAAAVTCMGAAWGARVWGRGKRSG